MSEGMRGAAVLERHLDEGLVDRVLAAVAGASHEERIRAGMAAMIEVAEVDAEEARAALWALRSDPVTMKRLEVGLDCGPERATLRLGAAIQLASAELASPFPDLRSRVPELLRWLEGTWETGGARPRAPRTHPPTS